MRPARSSTESSAITIRTGSPPADVVGPPSGLITCIVPPTDATRSTEPARAPCRPARSAPPLPSSRTSTIETGRRRVRCATRRACRRGRASATLVSASATTKYAVLSTGADGRCRHVDCSSTGTGERATTADSAASSPRSSRIAGWMPRTRSRSSSSAAFASSCASVTSSRALSGSASIRSRAAPRSIAKRDEALLRAVVEVAFDPAPLGLGTVDRSHPAGLELQYPRLVRGAVAGAEQVPRHEQLEPSEEHGRPRCDEREPDEPDQAGGPRGRSRGDLEQPELRAGSRQRRRRRRGGRSSRSTRTT